MSTLRDERLQDLEPDAPRPPTHIRPQAGVTDGCGDWACPHCYEADGLPIGQRQVAPEAGGAGVPVVRRCTSCRQPYPQGLAHGCRECAAYQAAFDDTMRAQEGEAP